MGIILDSERCEVSIGFYNDIFVPFRKHLLRQWTFYKMYQVGYGFDLKFYIDELCHRKALLRH